jgi:vacuolar-type H+-ATPase subunit H
MTNIHEALSQVKDAEIQAGRLVAEAREEAARLLLSAADQGRSKHAEIVRQAREESRLSLAKGKEVAEKAAGAVERETAMTLQRLEREAGSRLDSAVEHFLQLFTEEQDLGGR